MHSALLALELQSHEGGVSRLGRHNPLELHHGSQLFVDSSCLLQLTEKIKTAHLTRYSIGVSVALSSSLSFELLCARPVMKHRKISAVYHLSLRLAPLFRWLGNYLLLAFNHIPSPKGGFKQTVLCEGRTTS